MPTESTISIGVLLPDQLGTYADSGNATVLAQRLRWRGIPADIHAINSDGAPPAGFDIYLLGGAENSAGASAARWLAQHRALRNAIENTAVTLAVCAGMQILGHEVTDLSGDRFSGLGLIDMTTAPGETRAVGQIVTRCVRPEVGLLSGFENHRGYTTLGAGVEPLGLVRDGIGNNSAGDNGDGVLTDRIIATYMHGPVLARNPALADLILQRVVGHPLPTLDLPDVDAMRRAYLHRGQSGRRRLTLPSRLRAAVKR